MHFMLFLRRSLSLLLMGANFHFLLLLIFLPVLSTHFPSINSIWLDQTMYTTSTGTHHESIDSNELINYRVIWISLSHCLIGVKAVKKAALPPPPPVQSAVEFTNRVIGMRRMCILTTHCEHLHYYMCQINRIYRQFHYVYCFGLTFSFDTVC